MTPGESIKKIFLVKLTNYHILVSPGTGATLQGYSPTNELITDDLPTFGMPRKATEILGRKECNLLNYLRTEINSARPYGRLADA